MTSGTQIGAYRDTWVLDENAMKRLAQQAHTWKGGKKGKKLDKNNRTGNRQGKDLDIISSPGHGYCNLLLLISLKHLILKNEKGQSSIAQVTNSQKTCKRWIIKHRARSLDATISKRDYRLF